MCSRAAFRPLQMPSEEQWWSKPGAYKPQRRSGPFDARNKSVTTVTQTWSPPSWPLVCPVKMRPSKVRELSRPCDLVASVRPIGKVGSQLYETAPPGRQSPSRRRPVDLEAANLLKHDDNFDELGRPVDRWGIPIVRQLEAKPALMPFKVDGGSPGILQTATRGIRPGTAPGKLLTASPPRRSRSHRHLFRPPPSSSPTSVLQSPTSSRPTSPRAFRPSASKLKLLDGGGVWDTRSRPTSAKSAPTLFGRTSSNWSSRASSPSFYFSSRPGSPAANMFAPISPARSPRYGE